MLEEVQKYSKKYSNCRCIFRRKYHKKNETIFLKEFLKSKVVIDSH